VLLLLLHNQKHFIEAKPPQDTSLCSSKLYNFSVLLERIMLNPCALCQPGHAVHDDSYACGSRRQEHILRKLLNDSGAVGNCPMRTLGTGVRLASPDCTWDPEAVPLRTRIALSTLPNRDGPKPAMPLRSRYSVGRTSGVASPLPEPPSTSSRLPS